MREQDPMTQTIKASAARQSWSQILNRVYRTGTQMIIEKSGIPVAALIPAQELERLRAIEAERATRFAVLDQIRAKNADKEPAAVVRDVTAVVEDVRQARYD
ncbi:MAG TPA: type II toxin-antitoxin system prevent-host-death family antitoxin, partial [Chloroflexota bacterium]|nr:type II toxin-antitoxin system prevent-host-death family antitoxin [Chloroflexota bacterium]